VAASYCYNAALSAYFLLIVRHNRRPADIAKSSEPWLHVIPVLLAVIIGSTGLGTDVFNPSVSLLLCGSEPFPAFCRGNPTIDCVRGSIPDYALVATLMSIMLVCAVAGIVCTWRVYWSIRGRARQATRFSFDGQVSEAAQRR